MTTRPPEESDYDCAICLSPPDHQVHQCRNGHLFCAECLEECLSRASQAKCPTCRVALPREPIRNLVAERALARRPARCPHCSLDLTRGELQAHLLRCPSRVVKCAGEGCDWSGPNAPGALKEHEANCPRAILAKTLIPLKGTLKHPRGGHLRELPLPTRCCPSGRRQGSSWVESEQMLRAHMGSSLGERACAGARQKSALPVLKIARFACAAGGSAAGGERWTPDETPSPP